MEGEYFYRGDIMIQIGETWDSNNEGYFIIELENKEFCTVKRTVYNYYYPMDCPNGFEVYKELEEEMGIRNLTKEENDEIIKLCIKYDKNRKSVVTSLMENEENN